MLLRNGLFKLLLRLENNQFILVLHTLEVHFYCLLESGLAVFELLKLVLIRHFLTLRTLRRAVHLNFDACFGFPSLFKRFLVHLLRLKL